jgi:uncharacterized protein (UPF0276 family)
VKTGGAAAVGVVPALGIGLQLNPELLGWYPFFEQELDAIEVLFDSVMRPLDGPGLIGEPSARLIEQAAAHCAIVGHSNYGGDFGFDPLETTAAVRRHVPLAQRFGVPWVSNHCFYGDASWSDVWSSPLQFSEAEIVRAGARAHELQARYGVPLGHENAAYYRACPGSVMREEEFLAGLVEVSGTYLHLDLHNLYCNELNHKGSGYSVARFLDTIPIERVICVHLAGGRWIDRQYHDLHDTPVPEPVWDLLDEVLTRGAPGAVILEYETEALHVASATLDQAATIEAINADIARARSAWNRAYDGGRLLAAGEVAA